MRAAAGLDLCEGGEGTVCETLAPAEGLLGEMARAWFDSMLRSFLLYLRKDPLFFAVFSNPTLGGKEERRKKKLSPPSFG